MLRVVKLGGSLHNVPELSSCLKVLTRTSDNVVLVPGGGPFANTVRVVQSQSGISDAAAHRMAMLAMEQYAMLLCDLEPSLVPVNSLMDIAKHMALGHTSVWFPLAMCKNASNIPENWSVTSDSLAAWLAIELAAESLTLIKHAHPADTDPVAMSDSGWVDKAFPFFADEFKGAIHVLDIHEASIMGWLP